MVNGRQCKHVEAETAEYRWPPGTVVTFALDRQSVPPAAASFAEDSIWRGIAPWSRASALKTQPVEDLAEARVIIRFGSIDGPSGILGETEEPAEGRADVQHLMLLDAAESWTPQYLEDVARHEFGHAIGIGHSPGDTPATMEEYYDGTVHALTTWDVGQAVERYGEPERSDAGNRRFAFFAPAPGSYIVEIVGEGPISVSVFQAGAEPGN